MKVLLVILSISAFVLLLNAEKPPKVDIVEENGICLEEIKAVENCLKESGVDEGWLKC